MTITTPLTKLLGIDYPLIQAGMIWCSGARLAAAVSNAGGLGLIGSGSMDPATLAHHIDKARSLTDRPFGVNIPLIYRHVEAVVQTVIEKGVAVAFTSAGTPKRYTARLKEAGLKVFHVVSTPLLAQKSEAAGVDGVVAEGFEAGGHNGRDELTTMVLIPQVVQAVSVPVIAAGGIATGRQMAAALALGAVGVQVGTRFALTQESSGHQAFKRACLEAGPTDTMLVLKGLIPVRLLKNPFRDRIIEAESRCDPPEELLRLLGEGRARAGMFEGDTTGGELEIGQVSGMIADLPLAGEVVRSFVEEYRMTVGALP